MDFTRYAVLLSYIPSASSKSTLDIMGQPLPSCAGHIVNLRNSHWQPPNDMQYEVILCRFALSQQPDAYVFLRELLPCLQPSGYLIVQDYVLPEDDRVADYINGFIHLFDKKHNQSFARYAWDGLLLDVGLDIKTHHQRSIDITIQQWIDYFQPSQVSIQHAQILLVHAPSKVDNVMNLRYPGTAHAGFELQEIVLIAQKES